MAEQGIHFDGMADPDWAGKGSWNRRYDMARVRTNREKLNMTCCTCNGAGYLHADGQDIHCPDCSSRVVDRQSLRGGKTRTTYK